MNEDIENQIREFLQSGNKIAAIKRYREETGAGLADAKAAVESLEMGHSLNNPMAPAAPVDDNDPQVTAQIANLLSRGEKIEAIKLYRQQFGTGLKDAKEAVEQIGEQNGIPASSGGGCLGIFLSGLAGGFIAVLQVC